MEQDTKNTHSCLTTAQDPHTTAANILNTELPDATESDLVQVL
jgi:hypothetical protein